MLVHAFEARRLVEGGTTLCSVLPSVEDGVPLLLLEDALVASLRQLGAEPVVVGVLLHLLQRDDVRRHGLELLQYQVLSPGPRQRPLLTVGIHGLCCVQVCEDVPVHHLELLVQPLGVEGAAIADHPPRARLLGRGDDGACGDGHAADRRVAAVLQHRDDVQAEGPVDVLLCGSVRPRRRHLYPLRNGLFEGVLVRLASPHVLRQIVPAAKEAFLRAVAIICLCYVTDLRHLVRMEEAGLNDRPSQPPVPHVWAAPLVFEEPPILVAQGNIQGHLRNHHRSVPADQLGAHDRHGRLLIVTPGARSAAARASR
mmetsp:Transcript_88068/g.257444  ORF Transcript_88068/g.257444 Transcript_88068/m.257444 type:complete len:312 (-) Transcript_88068:95-1030(-)